MNEAVGCRIRELRQERGWNVYELARKADIVGETVLRIENGAGNPTMKTLEKVAGALGVPLGELMAGLEDG